MTKSQYRKFFSDSDWNPDKLEVAFELFDRKMKEWWDLSIYPNQFEIVSSEQLLDVYSSIGLPINYPHWSFGKDYMKNKSRYLGGKMGLSYEMVINSNPCISYNLEDNTFPMMCLVYLHAAHGHNAFFKNNYMFKQWTNPEGIVDYMKFAKDYINKCEEKYGYEEVELFLDACHSIQDYGVDFYKRPKKTLEQEAERLKKLISWQEENYDILDRIVNKDKEEEELPDYEELLKEPQENLLYFLEKNTPNLPVWKQELIRIVRKIAQYFYPQSQTKVENEGFATVTHYLLGNRLYDEGYFPDSFMLEFIKSHTNVIYQPEWNSPYFSGINPYTLGFNIFMDIKRICTNPTEEDKKWFPYLIGKNWLEEFKYAVQNFRDDSFIMQYLSPKVMRDMKLFSYHDVGKEDHVTITNIHEEEGYRNIREVLSKEKSRSTHIPNITVSHVDVKSRLLMLQHISTAGKELDADEMAQVLHYIEHIWKFDVDIKLL